MDLRLRYDSPAKFNLSKDTSMLTSPYACALLGLKNGTAAAAWSVTPERRESESSDSNAFVFWWRRCGHPCGRNPSAFIA